MHILARGSPEDAFSVFLAAPACNGQLEYWNKIFHEALSERLR